MKNYIKVLCGLLIVAAVGGATSAATAADVRVGLSTRETYVGQPVTLQIRVADATKAEPPTIPDVDGLTIRSVGTPSRSTQITTINGQTTTSISQTFAYEVTPNRPGSFRIPPITVNADGASQQTRAVEFVASKSETGDLMFVEIAGKQKEIYVGQSLDVTLKICLRPYGDRRLKVTLSEGDMWRLISERTEWGPFTERLQQLAERDQRPMGKEVLRKDAAGVEHSYYLYEVDATIYPKRPGTIDADNVKIVTNYPTSLGRSRGLFADFFEDAPRGRPSPFGDDDGFSPFGPQLTVQTVRPLIAQAVVEPIKVLPIPTADRPADYRGAVGQYQIAIDATPTHVKSGDPINLLIGVSGTGPMELVQAPPLAELPELAADFKVPNEPLAGFVKGDQKIFQTTIRPRKPGVVQIPSIPFSYFDPKTAKFETVRSKPVSITVEKAEMLALEGVKGAAAASGNDAAAKQSASGPTTHLEIFAGDDLLKSEQRWALNFPLLVTLLVSPPVIVLVLALTRARSGVAVVSGWFSSAANRLERSISNATELPEIGTAIKAFVARQYGLKGRHLTDESVVGAIRAAGHRNLAVRCEQLLNRCANEGVRMPFSDQNGLDVVKQNAMQWVNDWQAEAQKQQRKPTTQRAATTGSVMKSSPVRTSASSIVAAIVVAGSILAGGSQVSAESVKLSATQQQSLLTEANDCYNAALAKVSTDAAEAKQGFADAADKYQLLVGDGVTNSRLYFNLANSYLESGQAGKAIANYMRCLKIDPTMKPAQVNLAYAKSLGSAKDESADSSRANASVGDYAVVANDWLSSRFSPRSVFIVLIASWIAIWAAIGLRVLGYRLPWKTTVGAAALLFGVAAWSVGISSHTADRHEGVIVAAAPANAAGETPAAKFTSGQVVEVLQQRGDSVRIRAANRDAVWLPSEMVEAI